MFELSCLPRAAAIGLAAAALAALTAAGGVPAAPDPSVCRSPTDAARGAELTHVGVFAGVEESERALIGWR